MLTFWIPKSFLNEPHVTKTSLIGKEIHEMREMLKIQYVFDNAGILHQT